MLPSSQHPSHDYKMRAHIADVLNTLAETSDYDSISVTSLCQNAHVSRQTFYCYFSSKLDVALWQRRILLEDYFYQLSNYVGWNETLKMLLENNEKNRHLRYRIALSKENEEYLEKSAKLIVEFFCSELKARECTITNEIDFQIDTCAYATCHVLDNWGKSKMEMSPEQLTEYLDGIMPQKLKMLLEKPVISGNKHLL